jgi:hypothetical protein
MKQPMKRWLTHFSLGQSALPLTSALGRTELIICDSILLAYILEYSVFQVHLYERCTRLIADMLHVEEVRQDSSPTNARGGCEQHMHTCPVCWFANLPYPAIDYNICPCCGTEFGNDDAIFGWAELREQWIAGGMRWFFGRPPEFWNAQAQLLAVGYGVRRSVESDRGVPGPILKFA